LSSFEGTSVNDLRVAASVAIQNFEATSGMNYGLQRIRPYCPRTFPVSGTVKAFNFGFHVNFGPFIAKPVAL
jgi:hypothetical protein